MNTKLYTLRIYLPNGTTWTQTGVAYGSIAEVKSVWDRIFQHLPNGVKAEAIDYRSAQ